MVTGYAKVISGTASTGFTITNIKNTPKTADHTNVILYAGVLSVSILVLLLLSIKKKFVSK